MPDLTTDTTPSAATSAGDTENQNIAAPAAQPRPNETELAEWVERLYYESEHSRIAQAKTESWDDWINSYWGELWDQDLPTFKPPIVVNELQSLLLQEVSDLTDSPPRIFIQNDQYHPDRDKQREKALQAYWKREFVDHQIMLATLDAAIFPLGFVGVTYDPAADYGRGRLLTRCRSPHSVFPDPDCVDDDDWRYVILRDVLDLVAIRESWPDHGPKVRPDSRWSVRGGSSKDLTERSVGLQGRYSGPLYTGATNASSSSDGYIKARSAVLSCFILDHAVEEDIIERLNAMNEKTLISSKKKKYPHGRLIQVANGTVLYDGPNPYVRRFPLVRISLQPSIHSFWPPTSMLSGVLEIYKSANKVDSLFVENMIRLNAGLVVADTNTGIDPASFAAIPGQVILKAPGSTLEIKYPNPAPKECVEGGERLRQYARNVLGFPPSRIGQAGRGNVSPELTETEISQAMGLTRLRGRLLHNSTQKLAEIIFAGMARFYMDHRVFPNSRGDRWEPIQWSPVSKSPEDYIVHVDPASFEIRSKTMLQRLYFTLAKMNKMPNDELLQALNLPNAEELGEKLNRQLQLEAIAAANKQKAKRR